MISLFFDTATDLMVVGLAIDNVVIDLLTSVGPRTHGHLLVPKIQEILVKNEVDIKKIDEIIVGYGPGSYTGIRVAVMVAKMLCYTIGCELYVISSLDLLSSGYEGKVIAMIDARNDNYFSTVKNDTKTVLVEGLYSKSHLVEYSGYNMIELNSETIKTDLKIMKKQMIHVLNYSDLEPNYLRKTEAERNVNQAR